MSSTTTVVIQVLDDNDNQPKFTDKLFHIKIPEQRRWAGNQEVYRMVARDDDCGSNAAVIYRLQDAHDERFEIDSLTGVVTSHGDFWPGNYSILTVGGYLLPGKPGKISDQASKRDLAFQKKPR